MPLIDTAKLDSIERLPGWYGRYFDSANMTFGLYEFDAGATIHKHAHGQEEVWTILEGEIDITLAGETHRAGPGLVAVIPPYTEHSIRALTRGKAHVVDYPLRKMV